MLNSNVFSIKRFLFLFLAIHYNQCYIFICPLIEAHKAERDANGDMSPLERLKAQGGKFSISSVSYDIAEDALAELDAAFEDFAK